MKWARESYSVVPGVQLQTSGERTPGRTSPPGNTQALCQKADGSVARGAAMEPASVHLFAATSYRKAVFPKPGCLSGRSWNLRAIVAAKQCKYSSYRPALATVLPQPNKVNRRFASSRSGDRNGRRRSGSVAALCHRLSWRSGQLHQSTKTPFEPLQPRPASGCCRARFSFPSTLAISNEGQSATRNSTSLSHRAFRFRGLLAYTTSPTIAPLQFAIGAGRDGSGIVFNLPFDHSRRKTSA